MKDILRFMKNFYRKYWKEFPWIKAALIVGSVVAGLSLVWHALTQITDIGIVYNSGEITLKQVNIFVLSLGVLLIVYFALAAVLLHEQLHGERKLRELEESFRYDQRGTLFNGTEPNIAFRIATFKNIISNLGEQVGIDEMKKLLTAAGETAAVDFAGNLEPIFDQNVRRLRGGSSWDELDFDHKLSEWLEYDSHTGWGILTKKTEGKKIHISIRHLRGLFADSGGELFGHFLAGYCRTVVTAILVGHPDGFRDCCEGARIVGVKVKEGESVEIELALH